MGQYPMGDRLSHKMSAVRPFREAVGTKADNLILYVPDDVRSEILTQYRDRSGGASNWRHDPRRLDNIRRLDRVEELLGMPAVYHGWTQLALLRVLRAEGHLDEA